MLSTTLLALALCVSPAPDDVGSTVLRDGDVLSNGWTVDAIRRPSIADSGAWVALVGTTQPASGPHDAIVTAGGAVVLAEGDTLPTGGLVTQLVDADLDVGGLLAVLANIDTGGATTHSQLLVDGQLVTQTGIGVTGPGVPLGSRVFTMSDVEFAFPFLFVRAKLDTNAGPPFEAFLRIELPPSGPLIVDVVTFEGATIVGGAGPNGSVFFQSSIASDGTYLATLPQDVVGTNDTTVGFRSGAALYVEGAAGPIPNTTWVHQTTPAVAKAPGSSFALASTLREPTGAVRGIVIGNNQILAYEGQPVLGNPGSTVANFSEVAVAQAADGTTFFKLPTSTSSVIMAFDEVLARSSVDTAGGVQIASTKVATEQSLAVTSNGRQVLAEIELVGNVSALVLIERTVGTTISCSANPNSTGVPGKLVAFGQSFLAANDLTIVAFDLPQDAFGYLGCSRTPTFVPNAGGSSGNLCLGGMVGRYAANVMSSGSAGTITTLIDLTSIPQPTGAVSGVVGQIWGFQLWHRDVGATGVTSNFTEALAIELR